MRIIRENKRRLLLPGFAAISVLAVIAGVLSYPEEDLEKLRILGGITLTPEAFSGKVREAYQAAADIPEVLSQVECYCGCMQEKGHTSNLFCFKDKHAAG
jgi:hypothetical protein